MEKRKRRKAVLRKGGGEKILAYRTNTQIGHFEILDAMYVQTFVQHAMFDDAVAFLGRHGAGAQGVPGGLHVSCHPFLDVRDVLLGVLERLREGLDVAVQLTLVVEKIGLRNRACSFHRNGPGAMLQVGRDVVRSGVHVTGFQVHVAGPGR